MTGERCSRSLRNSHSRQGNKAVSREITLWWKFSKSFQVNDCELSQLSFFITSLVSSTARGTATCGREGPLLPLRRVVFCCLLRARSTHCKHFMLLQTHQLESLDSSLPSLCLRPLEEEGLLSIATQLKLDRITHRLNLKPGSRQRFNLSNTASNITVSRQHFGHRSSKKTSHQKSKFGV